MTDVKILCTCLSITMISIMIYISCMCEKNNVCTFLYLFTYFDFRPGLQFVKRYMIFSLDWK